MQGGLETRRNIHSGTVVKRHINKTRWWLSFTPSEKYARQIGSFFPGKKGWTPYLSYHLYRSDVFCRRILVKPPLPATSTRCHRRCGRVAQYISEIASCHFCGENPVFFFKGTHPSVSGNDSSWWHKFGIHQIIQNQSMVQTANIKKISTKQ